MSKKAVYCLQQVASMHSAQQVQGGLWDAIRKACGVPEQKIMRQKLYKYAENSARAQLMEQQRSSKSERERNLPGAENLNTDMAGDETMTNNMTSYRSWKMENAGVIEDREDIKAEEKSRRMKS